MAQKQKIIYFIEVKYRSSMAQGNGFEYVANQKLKRMDFAAQVWCQTFKWTGDYRLMAAAVSGLTYESIELIEIN